jgi:16S rRNA (uracil1498-N3)-methyltransferase
VALLIGPEGGLADEEMTAARGHGFDVLQLGPRVLRTETAPVVALSALGAHWGDIPL